MLFEGKNGPARYMIFAASTGECILWPGIKKGRWLRYDPQTNQAPEEVAGIRTSLRTATQETPMVSCTLFPKARTKR